METWVRPNQRAILVGAAVPLAVSLLTGAAAWWLGKKWWLATVPLGLVAVATCVLAVLILAQLVFPRISCTANHLELHLGDRRRTKLPLDVVECFFLGQGPHALGRNEEQESRNLVIRLAERATDWHHREVKRAVGHWCDGYITLNGIWCEPITEEMLTALNRKLAEAKRSSVK